MIIMAAAFSQRMEAARMAYRNAVEADGRVRAFGKGFGAFFANETPQIEGIRKTSAGRATLDRILRRVREPKGTRAFAEEMSERGKIAEAISEYASSLKEILKATAAIERLAKNRDAELGEDEKATLRNVSRRLGTTEIGEVQAELKRMAGEKISGIQDLLEKLSSNKATSEMEEAARVLDHLFKNAPEGLVQRLGGRAKMSFILGEGMINGVRHRIDALPNKQNRENEVSFITPYVVKGCIHLLSAVRQAARERNGEILERAAIAYSASVTVIDKPIFRARFEKELGKENSDAFFANARLLADKARVCTFVFGNDVEEIFHMAGKEGSMLLRFLGLISSRSA